MSAPLYRRFRTLLIANRGEIACRIIRTARAMGLAHGRRLFGSRSRCAACRDGRCRDPAGTGACARQLSEHRPDTGGGARKRRRGDPSGLRVPVRERRVRAPLCGGGPGVRRPDRRDDRGDGLEIRRQGADGEGGRAAGAGLSRRRAGRSDACKRSREDRLSGAGEGLGRRRRARYAGGSRMRRAWPLPSSAPNAKRRRRSATTAC